MSHLLLDNQVWMKIPQEKTNEEIDESTWILS